MSSVARALSTETGGVAGSQARRVDPRSPAAQTPLSLVDSARVGSTLAYEQDTVLVPSTEDALSTSGPRFLMGALTPGPLVGPARAGGTLALSQGTGRAPSIGNDIGASGSQY